jgi:putative membrane protein
MTETTPLAPSTVEATDATERLAAWVIGALTAIVIGSVALVIYVPRGGHADASSWLPAMNGTATVLLSTGYILIRRRRIAAHRTCMIAAFAASSLFLITYLIHHAQVGSVPFDGAAWLRPVYFGLLVPHIVLAALVVPLALTTIYRAWRGQFGRHLRLARVTLPIWLYVSVSGVLVYVLLYHSGRFEPPTLLVIALSGIWRRQGGLDAETTKPRDRNPGPRSARSAFRDPVVARQHFHGDDEAEDRSPSSQASAWSWSSTGIEEEGGLMAKTEEVLTQLATRIPKDLHRRLKLYCVTHEIVLMQFVTEAIEEQLGRKTRPKKGTV